MLAYFSYGKRRYFENPLSQQQIRRRFWEFQAVVQGHIGKIWSGDKKTIPRTAQLWLSPPGSDHSWSGRPRKDATIIVFHFRYIPESLNTLIGSAPHVQVSLTQADCRRLRELGARVQSYWNHPAPGILLCYEHALLELSMLVYESLNQQTKTAQQTHPNTHVQQALLWYNEHMHENPGLPEIARHAHSSPANLRRIFHDCLQASPKEMFDQLRYQRAMQLLTETRQPLAEIAGQCGFQDQSAFSRAFKHHFQCSPRDIRTAPTKNRSSG